MKYCKSEELLGELVVLETNSSITYSPVISQVVSQDLSQKTNDDKLNKKKKKNKRKSYKTENNITLSQASTQSQGTESDPLLKGVWTQFTVTTIQAGIKHGDSV